MKIKLIAVLACSTAALVAAGPANAKSGDIIPNSYICVFNAKAVNRGAVQAEANRAVNAAGGSVSHVYRYSIQGFAANMSAQAVSRMTARNPSIKYCEPDRLVELGPIEPTKGKPGGVGGGGGGSSAETTPWGVTYVKGGSLSVATTGARAWIIDSGIDPTHEDLNVDQSGMAQNFVPRDSSWTDLNGHGTHVSGTIGAIKGNGKGVVGVVPGALVTAVRVLDRRGSGAYSTVIAGIDWVAQPGHGKPGDVANMSLGGPQDDALDEAVLNAAATGVKFAIAAGNSADNANNYSPAHAGSIADARAANVYVVSAFDDQGVFAYFSNYGNPPIDYAEPGVNILSTWKNNGYNTISGTSMATPHLAGLLLAGKLAACGTVTGDTKDSTPDPIGKSSCQ
ncbi:S8 family serine peptidase [Novosphingobium malaysiense]|nr:S8 family serine peptidase [Novosphingobium malaysiense]